MFLGLYWLSYSRPFRDYKFHFSRIHFGLFQDKPRNLLLLGDSGVEGGSPPSAWVLFFESMLQARWEGASEPPGRVGGDVKSVLGLKDLCLGSFFGCLSKSKLI